MSDNERPSSRPEAGVSIKTDSEAADASKPGGKRFLVACEHCPLSHEVESRDVARRIGAAHQRATGHDVVAVEWPWSSPS
ncbi:hypothetical protein [Halobellus sp. GM3]|uniref:hypothetical protein n=1 Tax=Halobellus sp. GM3 TaxID=3458410 RepID=UPI00403E21FE